MPKQEQAQPFPTVFKEKFKWEEDLGGPLPNHILKAGLISKTEKAAQGHIEWGNGWRLHL